MNTGVLPIRATSPDHSSTAIAPGESGSVTMRAFGGSMLVDVESHVPQWFWISLLAVCFAPAAACTAVRRDRIPSGVA